MAGDEAGRAPVVVGVDGSQQAFTAVGLAAHTAARQRRALRIVHAVSRPLPHLSTGTQAPAQDEVLAQDDQRILADAAAHAAAAEPGLKTVAEVVVGPPAAALLAAARDASLLVLGDRGVGGFTSLLLGSVAVQVSAHSDIPVLVARGRAHPAGPVLLGVGDAPEAAAAIEMAFVEAEQRGADLLALRTWFDPQLEVSHMAPLPYDPTPARDTERQRLVVALAGSRARHPEVRVREDVCAGRAGQVLVERSHDVQLVVVGARGRGGFTGLLLGSTSQQVLHHADCPVLVVAHRQPEST
ncbi:universal stress protein [Catellatospora sp. NPDC049111]|uniref:universal stress protein n=1 Tax=Catellatospora sp. NPDC049111 TaxID=3155271 RepID=UPI0034088D5E